jgi:hypothetical protein
MYITFHFCWFLYRENTSFRFRKEESLFLKAYALVSIDHSLTHILNDTIMYFTHMHI